MNLGDSLCHKSEHRQRTESVCMQGYVVLNKTIKIGSKKNLGNFNITKQHSLE